MMNEREYWILDSVVECEHPVSWLLSPNLEVAWNRKHHGLGKDDLLEVLHGLFENGDLTVIEKARPVPRRPDKKKLLEALEWPIVTALEGDLGMLFGLTEKGGARWESEARPDWDRFLYVSTGYDPNDGILASTTEDYTREALRVYHQLPFSEELAVVSSIRWKKLAPWQATYWKILSHGHQVSFDFVVQSHAECNLAGQSPEAAAMYEELNAFERRTESWYKRRW